MFSRKYCYNFQDMQINQTLFKFYFDYHNINLFLTITIIHFF